MTPSPLSIKALCIAAMEQGHLNTAREHLAALKRSTMAQDEDVYVLHATLELLQQRPEQARRAAQEGLRHYGASEQLRHLLQRAGGSEPHRPAAPVAPAVPAAKPKVEGERDARLRVAVIVQDGLDQFLDDLVRSLGAIYDIRIFRVRTGEQIVNAVNWSDIVWLEWCNEVAVQASRSSILQGKPVLCRLHRYEAFAPFPERIDWGAIDRLVLVTDHLATLLEARGVHLPASVGVEVIRNGVDLSRYPFAERGPGHHLAMTGYLHTRKNPSLILQIMAALVARDERYQLHVAGTFQDSVLELYWHHTVQALGLQRNVHLDGWQDDIAGWLQDKHYLLHASIHESFGYGVAEAMACGIKPVIHEFPFAGEIWPPELRYRTVEEAVGQILSTDYQSTLYRQFIEHHYSLEAQAEQFTTLIDDLAREAGFAVPRRAPSARPAGASGADGQAPAASGDGASAAVPPFVHEPGALRAFLDQVQQNPPGF